MTSHPESVSSAHQIYGLILFAIHCGGSHPTKNQTRQMACWLNKRMNGFTIDPVAAGDFRHASREFGRHADVLQVFGLRRGTLYNLLWDGKIRAVLLRVRGQKSGVRLWDMASIREYIHSQMRSDAGSEQADESRACLQQPDFRI